jgi:phosphoserine aminotransferase
MSTEVKEEVILKCNSCLIFRSVGGIRASLYNAVTVENAEALGAYMKNFYQNYKK